MAFQNISALCTHQIVLIERVKDHHLFKRVIKFDVTVWKPKDMTKLMPERRDETILIQWHVLIESDNIIGAIRSRGDPGFKEEVRK